MKLKKMLYRVAAGSSAIAIVSGALLGIAGPAVATAGTAGVSPWQASQTEAKKKVTFRYQPYLEGSMRSTIGTFVAFVGEGAVEPGVKTSIQWYRNGKAIKGETGASHKIVAADDRAVLHVVITGRKPGYESTSVRTGNLPRISLRLTLSGSPTIRPLGNPIGLSGNPIVGMIYTASTDYSQQLAWDQPDRFTYQWKRNGRSILGATKATYRASSGDVGKKLSVTVKSYARGYIAPATNTSESTATVIKGVKWKTGSLKLRGTPKVGGTLTVSTGMWLRGAKFSYTWSADKGAQSPITTAGPSFKVPDTYAGTGAVVTVTAIKDGYEYRAFSKISPLITR